ncbi:MAG: methyltransferase domain-containing protein [Kiritimatiellaeota bacterium]|nr:methyltransferase domain-containing protein [Kiritimatiellota bacterium]
MFTLKKVTPDAIQAVYSGAEGQLWELIMGEQVHIGGMSSSIELATFGGVRGGMTVADLCCCSGAGMRFLLKLCGASHATGVDFTKAQLTLGKQRMAQAGIPPSQYKFHLGDVAQPHLKEASVDLVWGEDAWCYVLDKPKLVAQARRALKPDGRVAFSDWVATDKLTSAEAKHFMTFMKFPTLMTVEDYAKLLAKTGFQKVKTRVSPYFVPSIRHYLAMYTGQQAYDAFRLLGFSEEAYTAVLDEMLFIENLAKAKKIVQAYFAGSC